MREAAMADDDGFPFPFDFEQQLPAMDPLSPETQCQFILKRNRKMSNRIQIGKTTSGKIKQGVICKIANGKGLSQRVTLASSLACFLAFLLTPLFLSHFFMYSNFFSKLLSEYSCGQGSLQHFTQFSVYIVLDVVL